MGSYTKLLILKLLGQTLLIICEFDPCPLLLTICDVQINSSLMRGNKPDFWTNGVVKPV